MENIKDKINGIRMQIAENEEKAKALKAENSTLNKKAKKLEKVEKELEAIFNPNVDVESVEE